VAVECSRDSCICGIIDLWLFVPLVIVFSIILDVYCLGHSRLFFYTDMLLIYLKTYRNIVCLKDSFVPT
jgi:hypothetical protein